MVKIDVVYQGDLHTQCEHEPSGAVLATDAPVDNQGRGESFSPTERTEMSHKPDGQIEHSRNDRSIDGVGAEPAAVVRFYRVDVETHDVGRRQIDLDAHVPQTMMPVPPSRERGTLSVRELRASGGVGHADHLG